MGIRCPMSVIKAADAYDYVANLGKYPLLKDA